MSGRVGLAGRTADETGTVRVTVRVPGWQEKSVAWREAPQVSPTVAESPSLQALPCATLVQVPPAEQVWHWVSQAGSQVTGTGHAP